MPTLEDLFGQFVQDPLRRSYPQTLQDLQRETMLPAFRSAEAEGAKISAKPKEGLKERGAKFLNWVDELGEKYDLGPKLEATGPGAVAGWLLGAGHPAGAVIGAAMPWLADTPLMEEVERNVPPADLPGLAMLGPIGAGKAAKTISRRGVIGSLFGGALAAKDAPRMAKGLEGLGKIAEGGNKEALGLIQEVLTTVDRGVLRRKVNSIRNGVVRITTQKWRFKPNGESGPVPVPQLRDIQGITEEAMGYGQLRSDRFIRMVNRLEEKGVITEKELPHIVSELFEHEITTPAQLARDLSEVGGVVNPHNPYVMNSQAHVPKWVEKAFPGFSKYYETYVSADPDALSELLEHEPYTGLKKWKGLTEATDFKSRLKTTEEALWQRREKFAQEWEADQKRIKDVKKEREKLKQQIEEEHYRRAIRGEGTIRSGKELQRLPLQLPGGGGQLMRWSGPPLGLGLSQLYQQHVDEQARQQGQRP